MNSNLLKLLRALYVELHRFEWEDMLELDQCEVDLEFDLMPSLDENVIELDSDMPDETDHVGWPLCVECGNFSPSCVC
jgi:hypothetical protein